VVPILNLVVRLTVAGAVVFGEPVTLENLQAEAAVEVTEARAERS